MTRPPSSLTPAFAQEAVARRITARLSAGIDELPYDIAERLRAARVQAVARRKQQTQAQTRKAEQPAIVGHGGAAVLGGGGFGEGNWLSRLLASTVPLVALLAGLVVISAMQDEDRLQEIADVDSALLADDLPPAAYTDAGFLQFLKTNGGSRDQH